MPSKTLLNYITAEQKKGISEAAIRTQCLGAGWPTAMIDEAFAFQNSIKNGPGSPTAVSLKKRSGLVSLIRVGFGLLSLRYLFTLIAMSITTMIIYRATSSAAKGALPFQFLTLNSWFYPSVIGLAFLACSICLNMFFELPQRTKSVWNKALLSLIFLVIIEVTIQYLVIQFSIPLEEITNSQ